ncbi:NADP-specific glutamate dehydrogenase [Parvularcula sp. IMCC14364]|uniref:NADP-specific glutamate dehydrogenase n=1 Tax=Parvularcula sp. IMCC14364 TaxID=3067902 RepID=UPI0027404A1D|nr:NADP-specific glutamate dehydrogenase [Parvularcula sp. IMCC14364]
MAGSKAVQKEVKEFMTGLKRRNPHEGEFHQAVQELVETVMPYYLDHDQFRKWRILERMTEPDRVVMFRVTWSDDTGTIRANKAWRVQFNNAIGPYKGGMRFHPSVTLSVLKFLGFEQCFKNALTGLPMGGAKGGSNFNPKGRSDLEIMRFCHSLMTELFRHIGESKDVPAGDIGVGAREIGYMFGQYKRLENNFVGVLTGKGLEYGGSLIRKEATGYGTVYFAQNMLNHIDDSVEGKDVVVSGSGNVATYAIEKVLHYGGKPLTASDSGGSIYDPDGIDEEKLEFIKQLKEVRRGRISEYAEKYSSAKYLEGKRPWGVKCDIALPCATQNELNADDAKELIDNGVRVVAEGANMPSTLEAVHHFLDAGVLFGPAKAANAGGVAVSGLEQSQNSLRISWDAEEVDGRLQNIMKDIHAKCVKYGEGDGKVNYVAGANIAGFEKVAAAMVAYGVV